MKILEAITRGFKFFGIQSSQSGEIAAREIIEKKRVIIAFRAIMFCCCIFAVGLTLWHGIEQEFPDYTLSFATVPFIYAIATLAGEVFFRVVFRFTSREFLLRSLLLGFGHANVTFSMLLLYVHSFNVGLVGREGYATTGLQPTAMSETYASILNALLFPFSLWWHSYIALSIYYVPYWPVFYSINSLLWGVALCFLAVTFKRLFMPLHSRSHT